MTNIPDGLYHKDLGLPPVQLSEVCGQFRPDYTKHALRAALNDRYGTPNLPKVLSVASGHVVEVEVCGGRAVKAVVRLPHCSRFDLVLVIIPLENKIAVIKTVWLNSVNDKHSTLRKELYTRLPKNN